MNDGSSPNHAIRDEVIADSEEEIEYTKSFSAPSAKQQLHNNAISSISDFTTIAYGARNDEIVAVSQSIADRAKTRQRTQGTKKRPVVHRDDDIIELTSEDDIGEKGANSSAQSIKPKPKAKVKAKMAVDNPLPVTANSIVSEQPLPRVRPRPRPIVRKARPKLDSVPHEYPFARDTFMRLPAIQPPPISTPVPYHGQPDLPIATSPATVNNAMGAGVASQLPPSDPPNSTNTIGIGDTLPPIEILQDGESERDGDSHLLSPSSLFSDGGSRSKAKKRKRRVAVDILENDHEVDQLMPSSPQRLEPTSHVAPTVTVLDAYTHGPEPPPTFFAGSSTPAGQYIGDRDPDVFPNPQAEIIDLTDLPPTICHPKLSKPNTNKKVKLNMEINPTEEVGRDEGDSDFNPTGRKTAKKRKGKGKEPAREKEDNPKEKKGRVRKKKEQMDGVILQARDKTGKTKAKKKQIEKEVFKSREIIDDSDEGDPLLLVGGVEVEGMPSTTGGTSSPKVQNLNAGNLSPVGAKSPSSKVDGPKLTAAGSKAKAKGKKRKSIVESEEEGSDRGNEIQDCVVVKRRKSASDAPVSDEVKQLSPLDPGVLREDEERGNTIFSTRQDKPKDSKDCQRTNVQKVGKENISGPSTVRPLVGRATTINLDVSTPLYARYEVAPRRSSLPMSELIRRASFRPGSASFTPSYKDRGKGKKPDLDIGSASTTPLSLSTYSPYLKMSRRALSKIAPLHLNRKTPPPPAPPPPVKKKTKKELEREERWEEELVESVGGIEVWASMEDSERKEMKRAKRDMEMGGYDD